MKLFFYILGILFLSGCVAGNKLKHRYLEHWFFREGTSVWIFNRNATFVIESKSRDHVKQHDCFWGTWLIKKDTLFISYTTRQNMLIKNSSKVEYLKNDTLFVDSRDIYRIKVCGVPSLLLEMK